MSEPSHRARVCVAGSLVVDRFCYLERLPVPGETVTGHRTTSGFGGKGANQAVMAARCGAAVTMVGRVGDDAGGRDYLAHLAAAGIDVAHVTVTPGAGTGTAEIWVEDSGANAIVIIPGANDALTVADVEAASDAIASADVLVCQWEVPIDAVVAALRIARAAGVRTVFNPAPARGALPAAVYSLSDVICPNETEAAALAGSSAADAESAARAIAARGHSAVVVTLGERGALVVGPSGTRHHPAPEVTAVDTTGAGDAFVGAMAFALGAGVPIDDAVRAAVARASDSVRRPGTQTSYR
jgi:ribokinase